VFLGHQRVVRRKVQPGGLIEVAVPRHPDVARQMHRPDFAQPFDADHEYGIVRAEKQRGLVHRDAAGCACSLDAPARDAHSRHDSGKHGVQVELAFVRPAEEVRDHNGPEVVRREPRIAQCRDNGFLRELHKRLAGRAELGLAHSGDPRGHRGRSPPLNSGMVACPSALTPSRRMTCEIVLQIILRTKKLLVDLNLILIRFINIGEIML